MVAELRETSISNIENLPLEKTNKEDALDPNLSLITTSLATEYALLRAKLKTSKPKAKAIIQEEMRLLELSVTENCLGLIGKIAGKYSKHGRDYGEDEPLSLEDLKQEGFFGLRRALEKYDPTKEVRFSTYATQWIKQTIGRAIADKSREVRLPVGRHDTLLSINKTAGSLMVELGREPTAKEIGDSLSLSEEEVNSIRDSGRESISLFARTKIMKDAELPIIDFIASPNTNTEVEALNNNIREIIRLKLKELLTPEELKIVLLYWGFDGESLNYREIGNKLGSCRETIRKAEYAARAKLLPVFEELGLKDAIAP